MKTLNTNGEFKIGKLTVSNAKMSDVSLKLDGKNGVVKLKSVTANLYQGKYAGNVTINASGKLPRLTINTSLKEVQAEPLLNDVTGDAKCAVREILARL